MTRKQKLEEISETLKKIDSAKGTAFSEDWAKANPDDISDSQIKRALRLTRDWLKGGWR